MILDVLYLDVPKLSVSLSDVITKWMYLSFITTSYTWSLLVVVSELQALPCEPHKSDLWRHFQAHTLTAEHWHTEGYEHTAKDRMNIILCHVSSQKYTLLYGLPDYHESVLHATPSNTEG